MNKLFSLTTGFFILLSSVVVAQNQSMDTLSYSVGVLIAQNLKQQGFKMVESADVAEAVKDVFGGNALKISAEEAGQVVDQYMREQQQKQSAVEIEAGKKFLADNGTRKEVVTLPSGLQYEILTAGTGDKPAATDKVTTHYHGTLVDGTVFDSSVERGQPASFPVNGVIKGWQEALQLMPVGSKWRLYVPSDLAYGERGAGGAIKPFATLIFDVELLSIDK